MKHSIIVNISSYESRVAVLEQGKVIEVYVQRNRERGLIGNIYKARVIRVLPGMQAAFLDIGTDKAAFLYIDDMLSSPNTREPYHPTMRPTDLVTEAAYQLDEIQSPSEEIIPENPSLPKPNIQELITEGQELLIQVSKDPIGTKGPRVTTFLSLAGRHLVFMPNVNHIGISRRIEKETERNRLIELVKIIKQENEGYIIRTLSEGIEIEKLKSDAMFLRSLWAEIEHKAQKARAPSLVQTDLDLPLRVVRDIVSEDTEIITVDNYATFEKLNNFLDIFAPSLKHKVQLYQETKPIFDYFGVEDAINRSLSRKIWLKSGGFIIIDQAEALTAIDVNTGKFVGSNNLEETLTKTNLEAVKEIALQLRLRNIGGIIIIDFIDMADEKDRKKVFTVLEEELSKDKAKTNILKISELGLVEMTRKRVTESLGRILTEPCFYCNGKGTVKSITTVTTEIFREIMRQVPKLRGNTVIVNAFPEVADRIELDEKDTLQEMRQRFGKNIIIQAKQHLHLEHFELYSISS